MDDSSATPLRWGMVGPGRIAHRFADSPMRWPLCRVHGWWR